MYDWTEYINLTRQIKEKYQNMKITLSCLNLDTNKNEYVIKNATNNLDKYEIVFDPNHVSNYTNHPDSFYCNTFNEFKTIILYIVENPSIYITGISDDYLDLDTIKYE